MTRRGFLGASALTAGMVAARAQSPNERIGIGVIGCGGRGNHVLGECVEKRDALNLEIVALCDVWQVNLLDTADRVEKSTGRRPKTCTRYAELLAMPEVDAVFITTPDFGHSPILIDTANARKHVYVEKPMANLLDHANAAVDAVESSGVVCQVGTQYRSQGEYIASAKLYQQGVLGELIKAHTTYNDHKARWERDYSNVRAEDIDWEQYLMHLPPEDFDARRFRLWHLYKDFCTGLIGLLGVHPIDIAHYFTGDSLPESCVGMGRKLIWTNREHDDTQECLFTYSKGHLLQFSGRLGNDNGGPMNVFYGSRGTFETGAWTFTGAGGGEDALDPPIKVEPEQSTTHIENWIQCIRENNRNTRADVHAGYAHTLASIMGYQACESGKTVVFDPAQRSIKEV